MQREWAFRHHTNERLLEELKTFHRKELENVAGILRILEEVDRRRLYLELGYPSLYQFCIGELFMSEQEAYLRMTVARTGRRFPVIFGMIARGELHLTGASLVAQHLTPANHRALLGAVAGKTKQEIKELIAARFPKPDLPESIRRLPSTSVSAPAHTPAPVPAPVSPASALELAPSSRQPGPAVAVPALAPPQPQPPPPASRIAEPRRGSVEPLSPERYAIRFTGSRRCRELLERAKALLSHRSPNADVADVVEEALAAYVEKLEKQKFKTTDRPRASKKRSGDGDGDDAKAEKDIRYITAEVKRAVYLRDGGTCTYVGPNGHRCCERAFLEYDHIVPVARGGESSVDNLRLRCRAHNGFTARQEFGDQLIDLMSRGFRPVTTRPANQNAPASRPPHERRNDRQRASALADERT